MPVVRFLLLLAALFWAPLANAQTFPKLSGRVVDTANLLDPAQEQALTAKLDALEKASGRQLVVVTLPSLQDYDIADYGYRLGRSWGIGEKDRNTGALLIIAPNERKMRIEVGYGLEGVLTDALSKRIISTAITPRFKAGDMPGGIDAGVDQLSILLRLPPEEAAKRAAAAEKAEQSRGDGGVHIVSVIFWLMAILFFVIPLGRRMSGGGRRYGARSGLGAGLPVILWGPGLGGWGGNGGGGGSGWGGFGGGDGGGGGGGFSGGGGSFGGGGASGDW